MTIYILRCGDFAKVGYSKDPERRLRSLERAMPIQPEIVATFDGSRATEFKLHHYLREHHARHEWFHWCDALENIVRHGLPILPDTKGSPFAELSQYRPRVAERAA